MQSKAYSLNTTSQLGFTKGREEKKKKKKTADKTIYFC